jgi:manganese/zinc/iron transport system substrate-binding protein
MKAVLVIILLALLSLGAAGGLLAQEDEEPINVVATIGMIADAARIIGGDRVEVIQLMGEGVDPHLYVATASDTLLFVEAEIILYNGLNLEPGLIHVIEQIGRRGVTVAAVAEAVREELRLDDEELQADDPHVWMDVGRWMIVVEAIAEVFTEYNPDHAEEYLDRAAAYLEELEELDEQVRAAIESIPEGKRILVTAHDAFGYFGDAYGIEVFAPQAMTTEAEVGVEDIRATVELLVTREIPAIFVETTVSPDTVMAVVEAAAARDWQVIIAEPELYSDAMGPLDTFEGTYIGMITANTNAIVRNLGGEVFVPVPDDEDTDDED